MKKLVYWILPISWMGIIFYSSSTPYEKQDVKPLLGSFMDLTFLEPYLNWITFTYNGSVINIDALGVTGFIEFFIRKGAHFTVFFILMCLFYLALIKTLEIGEKHAIFYSFFLTVAYAIVDEVHQGFTPNRTPYFGDVLIDAIGAIFAVICIVMISRIRRIKKFK